MVKSLMSILSETRALENQRVLLFLLMRIKEVPFSLLVRSLPLINSCTLVSNSTYTVILKLQII